MTLAAEGVTASPHLRGRALRCEHEECGAGEPSGCCCSSEGCGRGTPWRGSPPLEAPQWLAPRALPPPGRMKLSCCPCCPPVSNDLMSVVVQAGEDSMRVTGALLLPHCLVWHARYQNICSVLFLLLCSTHLNQSHPSKYHSTFI